MQSTSAVARQDHDLLTALVRRVDSRLRGFLRRRPVADAEVDDLMQETFLRLAHRADLAEVNQLEPYLFQTARSVINDHLRRQAARITLDGSDDEAWQAAPDERSPERCAIGSESLQTMTRVLAGLPERARHAFILNRFEGMSYQTIARRLGVSVSSIEKDIMLALAQLSASLHA